MEKVEVSNAWIYAAYGILHADGILDLLSDVEDKNKEKIANLVLAIDSRYNSIEEQFSELIKRCGEKDKNGNLITSDPEIGVVVTSEYFDSLMLLMAECCELTTIKSNVVANVDLPKEFFNVFEKIFVD